MPLSSSQASDSLIGQEVIPAQVWQQLADECGREQRKMRDLFGALAFALRSFNNLNQVLELIAFVACNLTNAEGGALVLFHADGKIQLDQLHCADLQKREQVRTQLEKATHTLSSLPWLPSPEAVSAPLSVEGSPGSSELSHWVETLLDRQFQHDLGEGTHLFGTPLLIRNSVRGRLYVFSRQPDYQWNENRQQLLRVIADQAAVAIENDELTLALRQKVALDKELEIGSEIQAQLLPRQYPHIPGIALAARCQTANKVGGDYYDFIKVPIHMPSRDQGGGTSSWDPSAADCGEPLPTTETTDSYRLGIVIGDVMGKGVPAGLLMTMTRGMLRAEILNYHRPSRILQHLNQVMFHDLETSNRFVSLFYSEYNPVTRELRFSNAAHNPTLWWQAATGQIHPLDTVGALVGLDAYSTYDEKTVQLAPGDVVVYYTDGFTEAANPQGERLEMEGLERAIQYAAHHFQDPQGILDSLFEQVEVFQGHRPLPLLPPLPDSLSRDPLPGVEGSLPHLGGRIGTIDDRTLVVLKVLPENS